MAQKIKRNDMVKVIAGKDIDKEGKVLSVDAKNHKVVVEGINMATKHTKPSMQNQAGGFKCVDGKKVRFAKSTGEVID